MYGDMLWQLSQELSETDQNKSGFFNLPEDKSCKDKQHNPPSHICIPKGKGYRHVCPSCGKETVIIPQQITL